MSDLFWLSDEQMARFQPYFPMSHGKPRVDDKRVLRAFPVFVETRVSPVSRERRRRGRVLAIQHKLETL